MKDKSKKSTYSTTFGVDPNQLLASRGVVSQINPYSELTENENCYAKFQTTERGGFEPPVGF